MNGCHASDVTSTADTKVDEMTPSVRVPERFAQTVVAHLIKNVAPTVPMGTDLILGIHGPPGFGKTYQTNALMHLLGADIHEMSVGSFEAADAGGPVRTLRKTYESASDRIRDGHPAPQVVVLHDLDAAIGDWGPLVQTTMNRQLIFGELMQIADSPDRVAGFECTRVPIIATGNDLGRLYPQASAKSKSDEARRDEDRKATQELQAGRFDDSNDVVFIHTGGVFGLFPQRDQFVY